MAITDRLVSAVVADTDALAPEKFNTLEVNVLVFIVPSTVRAPLAWMTPAFDMDTPLLPYPPPIDRESNDAAPAPVTDHWASVRARSLPDAAPIVMVPPEVLPMVVLAVPVVFIPTVPVNVAPAVAVNRPFNESLSVG